VVMATECVPPKACAVELATETGPQPLIQPSVVPFWKFKRMPLVGGGDEEDDGIAAGVAGGVEREADVAVFRGLIAVPAPMMMIKTIAAIKNPR
jgi:hypothetical protein